MFASIIKSVARRSAVGVSVPSYPLVATRFSLNYTPLVVGRPLTTETPPAKQSGLQKPIQLSPTLSQTLGVTGTLTRPQATKKLWEYIKANNLQDPNDGRQIINDAAFREIFECEEMSMFTMTKLVQKHIIKL